MNRQEDKYKIAQEVWLEYYSKHDLGQTFNGWIQEKNKPKDPLFKNYLDLMNFIGYNRLTGGRTFIKFKEIFAEELNGTKGLNETIEWYKAQGQQYTTSYEEVADNLIQIKKRMDK